MTELEFIKRVLEIYSEEADLHSELFWRVDHPDPGLHLYAMCNDTFYWASADAEEITPVNLSVLEQTSVDLQALEAARTGPVTAQTVLPMCYLGELFAARVRHMRPQRPKYRDMSPGIAALFDSCGPERDRKDEG